jgi:hypothetical protein
MRTAHPFHPELQQLVDNLVEQARNLEGVSTPRKHHLVPASYLKRWSCHDRILVTDINTRACHTTTPNKAARDTDFYRIESVDIDRDLVPPLLFEKMLSVVEDAALKAFDVAIAMETSRFDEEATWNLATFISFQLARGHRFRARNQLIATTGYIEMYRHVTEDGIAQSLRDLATDDELASAKQFVHDLRHGRIIITDQQAAAVWKIGETALQSIPYLMDRTWHVVETDGELVTTDEPVLLLGGPGWPRGQQPGLNTARVILMPLSPFRLLILAAADLVDYARFDKPLTADETEQINVELLANAHRWQYSTVNRRTHLPCLPPPVPPWILERGIKVADQPNAEVLHGFSPNRWLYTGNTPWPVARWWSGKEQRQSHSPTAFMKGNTVTVRTKP